MSETKHTPGPWTWECTEQWSWLWGPDGGSVLTLLSHDPTAVIGLRQPTEHDGPPWEFRAATADHPDARLIAASPDLLDMTERLASMMSDASDYDHTGTEWRGAIEEAQELVKKVRDQ